MKVSSPRRYVLLALCWTVVASCSTGDPSATMSGTWDVVFTLEHSTFDSSAAGATVHGRIVLNQLAAPDTAHYFQIETPTYKGRYAVQFDPFGFDPARVTTTTTTSHRMWGNETVAVARIRSPVSVLIVLNPYVSHGGVRLWTHVDRDSCFGSWDVPGTGPLAYGSFVMHRAQTTD